MTASPRRIFTYMAGAGVPQLVAIVEAFLRLRPGVETVYFLIGDRPMYAWAKGRADGDPRIQFHYQHDRFDPFRAELPDPATLAALEARYGMPHLGRFIMAQRSIKELSRPRQLAYVAAYLLDFERRVKEFAPDAAILAAPDSAPFMAANTVVRRHGCHTVTLAPGRLPGRFYVVTNEQEHIPGLAEAYAAVKARGVTADEAARVAELRRAYTARRLRPSYYGARYRLRRLPTPAGVVRAVRRYWIQDDRYFDFSLGYYVRHAIAVRLREPLQQRRLRRLARRGLPERFIYMPLNFEPESAIDVQAGFFHDQLGVVQRVLDALPSGYALVVKEHPNMTVGGRPLGFYRRLTAMGAWLVPQQTDSYDILQGASAVATIGGTTGVEALFWGRPVVLIGHAFYEVFREGVAHVRSLEELAPAIRRAIDLGTLAPDDVDRFVTAVLERSYPGAYELPSPDAMTPANFETMARGIAAEMAV